MRCTVYNLTVVQLKGCGVAGVAAVAGEDLSLTFAALADPTRRAILERLAFGAATVTEIAEPFAMTQQAISKHLKVLERAGLISRSRTAQSRPCQLEDGRLGIAADWISRNRRMWQERYDRLDGHVAALRWAAGSGPPGASTPGEGTSGAVSPASAGRGT